VEDEHGLQLEAMLPKTQLGADVRELVRRGDLAGCSFAFAGAVDKWSGRGQREIISVDKLIDVSLTAFPAYPETEVAVRTALALRSYPQLGNARVAIYNCDDAEDVRLMLELRLRQMRFSGPLCVCKGDPATPGVAPGHESETLTDPQINQTAGL